MNRNTFNALLARVTGRGKREHVSIGKRWIFEITRADGSVERREIPTNTMQYAGLNKAAQLLVTNGTNSAFLYLIVGTETDEASLGSTDWGEVTNGRKIGATVTTSHEVAILVATWAGNADGLTGVALASCATGNHASSGQGEILNIVNSVDATLADSDFLKVQMEIQVGSHNLP